MDHDDVDDNIDCVGGCIGGGGDGEGGGVCGDGYGDGDGNTDGDDDNSTDGDDGGHRNYNNGTNKTAQLPVAPEQSHMMVIARPRFSRRITNLKRDITVVKLSVG